MDLWDHWVYCGAGGVIGFVGFGNFDLGPALWRKFAQMDGKGFCQCCMARRQFIGVG